MLRKEDKVLFNYLKNLFVRYQKNKDAKMLSAILNDGRAIFSSFGQDVYLSDQVNNCIDRIATEISKIDVVSVVQKPGSVARQNDDITRLFRFKPNPLQTTKDFLACCEWLRRKDCNCFIYPQYDLIPDAYGNLIRYYTAFWPLNPRSIEIGQDEQGTIWEIKFYWRDGSWDILPYEDLVHLRWRRGKNTIVGGGDDFGRPDTRDLLAAVDTFDKVRQALPKALETSLKLNGVYNVKTVMAADKLKEEEEHFEDHIKTSPSGIVALDLGGEFVPVKMNPVEVKPEVMNLVKATITERYGISEALLSGDYTAEQHGAFYQSCLEDFITEFEQGMSACLFTPREQDVGHRVRCYYSKTTYLSTANKIALATLATNTGLKTLNEINEMFGDEPFEGGDRRLQSLNFVNTQIVDNYQLNMAASGKLKAEPGKDENNGKGKE
jgi:HK97 family phage portal protein